MEIAITADLPFGGRILVEKGLMGDRSRGKNTRPQHRGTVVDADFHDSLRGAADMETGGSGPYGDTEKKAFAPRSIRLLKKESAFGKGL